jgi:hypothetical protein
MITTTTACYMRAVLGTALLILLSGPPASGQAPVISSQGESASSTLSVLPSAYLVFLRGVTVDERRREADEIARQFDLPIVDASSQFKSFSTATLSPDRLADVCADSRVTGVSANYYFPWQPDSYIAFLKSLPGAEDQRRIIDELKQEYALAVPAVADSLDAFGAVLPQDSAELLRLDSRVIELRENNAFPYGAGPAAPIPNFLPCRAPCDSATSPRLGSMMHIPTELEH